MYNKGVRNILGVFFPLMMEDRYISVLCEGYFVADSAKSPPKSCNCDQLSIKTGISSISSL